MDEPRLIEPQPMRRQCFSTRRERAMRSLTEVHTGEVRTIFARSFLTASTRPPVEVEPMLTMRTSPLTRAWTREPLLVPVVLTPRSRRRRKNEISSSTKMSGSRLSLRPRTLPTRRSARQSVGSIIVPTPMSPPGTAYLSSFCSASRVTIREKIGSHAILPAESLETIPGRTSISSPSLSTPRTIEPPATPPLRLATEHPGLLTSNERMMIIRGSETKSRFGIGTFVSASRMTSRLSPSWAEMGITGARSATVPLMNARIWAYCSCACD
eukprot:Amastigsp_a134_413.p3 type:complete len:269 gc:universal Amastigsp_a134_413:1485-679(-)